MADLCAALNFKEGNREHVAVEKGRDVADYDLVSIALACLAIHRVTVLGGGLRRPVVPDLAVEEAIDDTCVI